MPVQSLRRPLHREGAAHGAAPWILAAIHLCAIHLASSDVQFHPAFQLRYDAQQLWQSTGLTPLERGQLDEAEQAVSYWAEDPANLQRTPWRTYLLLTAVTNASVEHTLPALLDSLALFKSRTVDGSCHGACPLDARVGSLLLQSVAWGSLDRLAVARGGGGARLARWGLLGLSPHQQLTGEELGAQHYGGRVGVGLAELRLLVLLLALGHDLVFVEPHRVFFKNPVTYLYEYSQQTGADILLPPATCSPPPVDNGAPLETQHMRLDLLFVRSSAATLRCLYSWLWWASSWARPGAEHALDPQAYTQALRACQPYVKIAYLPPEAFPNSCAAPCGCEPGGKMVPFERHASRMRRAMLGGPDPAPPVRCPASAVQQWVSYHFHCVKGEGERASQMRQVMAMVNDTLGGSIVEEQMPQWI